MNLQKKIAIIIRERKDLLELGCKNEKMIYECCSIAYKHIVSEEMPRRYYDTAVRIMFRRNDETSK